MPSNRSLRDMKFERRVILIWQRWRMNRHHSLKARLISTYADQQRFDIKEALSILEPDLSNHEARFRDYRALIDYRKGNWLRRIALTTPLDVYSSVRNWCRIQSQKHYGAEISPVS